MYAYYFLCKKKLWLYARGISMESENADVNIGKTIENDNYKFADHNILIDNTVCIDYIKKDVVYEIKKSDKQEQTAINQVKYYLYFLYKKGLKMSGKINYPEIKKTTEVFLTENDISEIENNLADIKKIISADRVPDVLNAGFCKRCAYYELCYI